MASDFALVIGRASEIAPLIMTSTFAHQFHRNRMQVGAITGGHELKLGNNTQEGEEQGLAPGHHESNETTPFVPGILTSMVLMMTSIGEALQG